MKTRFILAAMLAGLAGQLSAQEATSGAPSFEYHGYMRSGIGASRGGADQTCFAAPGASAKFRLGNECETYLEATFVNNHALSKASNSAVLSTHLNIAATTAERHDWESTSPIYEGDNPDSGDPMFGQEFTLALREAYVEAKGVLGSARPWIGKRFYRRQDIHILDYYIINNSGPGAGVEDINVGIGNLHLAVTRNTNSSDDDTPAQVNPDFRLSDINLGVAGKLEALLIYGAAGKHGHKTGTAAWQAIAGEQLGVVHSLDTSIGFNRVTLQYGRGIFGGDGAHRANLLGSFGGDGAQAIAKGDDDTLDARKKSASTRIAEELLTSFGRQMSSSVVLVYQTADFGGYKDKKSGKEAPKKAELMAGLRPVYQFSDELGLAFEYGFVNVKNAVKVDDEYKDASLHKLTIAPELTAGPDFFARPQLRLFATYAKWNDDAKGQVGNTSVYAGSTSGFSTGAQFEAWW